MRERLPTAPLAGAGFIAGWAVVAVSGSRPLGGVVLAAFGVACIWISSSRDSPWITTALVAVAASAFVLSHLLGLVIGAWPAVIVAASVTAALCWRLSDARRSPSMLVRH